MITVPISFWQAPAAFCYHSGMNNLLSRITIVPFTLATIAGAIPWNLALAFAGYKLGQNYERVASALGPFTIPLAILVLLAIVVAYYYGRRIGEDEAS